MRRSCPRRCSHFATPASSTCSSAPSWVSYRSIETPWSLGRRAQICASSWSRKLSSSARGRCSRLLGRKSPLMKKMKSTWITLTLKNLRRIAQMTVTSMAWMPPTSSKWCRQNPQSLAAGSATTNQKYKITKASIPWTKKSWETGKRFAKLPPRRGYQVLRSTVGPLQAERIGRDQEAAQIILSLNREVKMINCGSTKRSPQIRGAPAEMAKTQENLYQMARTQKAKEKRLVHWLSLSTATICRKKFWGTQPATNPYRSNQKNMPNEKSSRNIRNTTDLWLRSSTITATAKAAMEAPKAAISTDQASQYRQPLTIDTHKSNQITVKPHQQTAWQG